MRIILKMYFEHRNSVLAATISFRISICFMNNRLCAHYNSFLIKVLSFICHFDGQGSVIKKSLRKPKISQALRTATVAWADC